MSRSFLALFLILVSSSIFASASLNFDPSSSLKWPADLVRGNTWHVQETIIQFVDLAHLLLNVRKIFAVNIRPMEIHALPAKALMSLIISQDHAQKNLLIEFIK